MKYYYITGLKKYQLNNYMSDLFFTKPFCECNLDYGVAWFFFTLGNGFFWSMIWVNPINLDYGTNSNVVKFIFSCATFFIICLFTRIMCKQTPKYIDLEAATNYQTYEYND